VASHDFIGHCTRCKARVTATVAVTSTGTATVCPPAVIGCWCECPDRHGPDGPRAVPLIRREAV
jgi:hypothetical protein